MKKIIICTTAILTFSYLFGNEYPDLKHNQTINELFKKYDAAKDPQQQQFYLTAAAEQHSGLANYLLAEEANTPYTQKINYYLEAAKYGYPNQSYKAIAKIYNQGLGVTKDEFKSECYKNLSLNEPNKALIEACQSRYPSNGFLRESLGLQSSYEINRQADMDYKAFCDDNNNLLNPNIDKYEQHLLVERLCNKSKHKNKKDTLNIGDLIFKNNKILKKTAKGYIPYNKKISDGLVVYRPNPPFSIYIAKENELIPAKNGDQVLKDGHTYIVENNRLEKYKP